MVSRQIAADSTINSAATVDLHDVLHMVAAFLQEQNLH